MTTGFGFRVVGVSICNYLFGNILFALSWGIFHSHFVYWQIAIACTFISSIFSYQTQSRLILRRQTGPIINYRYIAFQLLGLALAILLVPAISNKFELSVILLQFAWSAFYSLSSLLMLQKNKFTSGTISGIKRLRQSDL